MNGFKKFFIGTASAIALWVTLDIVVANMAVKYQFAANTHYSHAAAYLSVARNQLRTEQELGNHLIMIKYQMNESPVDNYARALDQRQDGEVCTAKAEACWKFVEKYGLSSNMSRLMKKIF
jgi:hypothetical protein